MSDKEKNIDELSNKIIETLDGLDLGVAKKAMVLAHNKMQESSIVKKVSPHSD